MSETRPVPPPEPPDPPGQPARARAGDIVVIVAALVILAAIGARFALRVSEPTAAPPGPVSLIGSGSADPDVDGSIDGVLARFFEAQDDGDATGLVGAIDLPGLLTRIDLAGGRARADDAEARRSALLSVLVQHAISYAARDLPRLEELRITRALVAGDGDVAVAFAIGRSGAELRRTRFWLSDTDGGGDGPWRIVDWESLDEGIPASVRFGFVIDGLPPRYAEWRKLMTTARLLAAEGDLEGAFESLAWARTVDPHPAMRPRLELLEATLRLRAEQPAEALARLDAALAARNDLPLVLYLRAEAFTRLGRDEESFAASRAYRDAVGEE